MSPRLERIVTSGTFSLDGGTWDVDNNVWLFGDDDEVLVVDAAHDASAIEQAVGDRELVAIVCTHAHDDHVSAARELALASGAPVLLHPADEPLWRLTYPDWRWTRDLGDGRRAPRRGRGGARAAHARPRARARTATARRSWPRSASGC